MNNLKINQLYLLITNNSVLIVIIVKFTEKGLIVLSKEDSFYEYGFWLSYKKIKRDKCLIPLDSERFIVDDEGEWERDPNNMAHDI